MSHTSDLLPQLPPTWRSPDDVLGMAQPYADNINGAQLPPTDLNAALPENIRFLGAQRVQVEHTQQAPDDRFRADYEFSRLTAEQVDEIAAWLDRGFRREIVNAIHNHGLRSRRLPHTWQAQGHNLLTTGRELVGVVGRHLGVIPVATTTAASAEVRTSSTSGDHALYPAGSYDSYSAASVAAPVVPMRHTTPPAPSVIEAHVITPTQPLWLAEFLSKIDPNPQPRQYRPMDLTAAAAFAPTVAPDGDESLAAVTVRRLNEGDTVMAPSTRPLPAVALDRYGRIATDGVTKELPVPPTDDSGRLRPTIEEVMAEQKARSEQQAKLMTVDEAIFLNFGRPAEKRLMPLLLRDIRMPLPPVRVNKNHNRLARRALDYIRAIPEDSPESNLQAALRKAELFVDTEELVTYALAIAGVTRAAKGEPLTQVATAVARSLERAAQHHVEARIRQPLVHTDEQQIDLSTPSPVTIATETESPHVQNEGVNRAVSTAASGFAALRALYYQHDKSARSWVRTPGFISGIDQALAQADPGLYGAAAQYFSVRGVQMNHVIATALLDYDGPKDTAHFLPILHRSLRDVLSESGPNVAVAS